MPFRIRCASLPDMNKQRLEFEVAYELVGIATDIMESHHEEGDIEAAIQAVFATALEIASRKSLKSMEEIFK